MALTSHVPNTRDSADTRAKLPKVAVINFRSIMGKKADLLELISMQKPTWLSPEVSNNEIIPSDFNYNIYRNDRADGYGGVMLAISNQLSSLEVGLRSNCLVATNCLWVHTTGHICMTNCQ